MRFAKSRRDRPHGKAVAIAGVSQWACSMACSISFCPAATASAGEAPNALQRFRQGVLGGNSPDRGENLVPGQAEDWDHTNS